MLGWAVALMAQVALAKGKIAGNKPYFIVPLTEHYPNLVDALLK